MLPLKKDFLVEVKLIIFKLLVRCIVHEERNRKNQKIEGRQS